MGWFSFVRNLFNYLTSATNKISNYPHGMSRTVESRSLISPPERWHEEDEECVKFETSEQHQK
jgi:hypothetical protein